MMSKKVDYLASKMIQKPYLIAMGAGKLSRWYKMSKDEVYEARVIAKASIASISENNKTHMPNILVLDIETAPIKAFVWCSLYGKTVAYVVHRDIRYAKWMLEAGFPFDDRVARAISCIKIKNYNERKK